MSMDEAFRARCPSCDMLVDPVQSHKYMPFCSERCRLVDLGRWLNEEHALPFEAEDDEEQELSESDSGAQRKAPRLPPGWHDA